MGMCSPPRRRDPIFRGVSVRPSARLVRPYEAGHARDDIVSWAGAGPASCSTPPCVLAATVSVWSGMAFDEVVVSALGVETLHRPHCQLRWVCVLRLGVETPSFKA